MVMLLTVANNTSGLGMGAKSEDISYSTLVSKVASGEVKSLDWQGKSITGTYKNGDTKFTASAVDSESATATELLKTCSATGTVCNIKGPAPMAILGSMLALLLPTALLLGFIYFFFWRSSQMGGNQAMNFGRSKAKRVGESGTKITFDDVAGIDEAKNELFEIVDFLKNTKKYSALGAKIPKGILLTGPPGVGKTYLARAIAGEAGVPFFHISGSDFVEMFVGVGAARVRDLFETAKAHRPSLIFIDEIDAVGRQRGAGLGGGHDEREQTLNQMLVEMDGFDPNSGVIMIAATNRPDVLDPALLRPGRFDRQLVVDAPDSTGRHAILKVHAKGKPLDGEVDLESLAKRTSGFTGADLANILNEGALLAARNNHSRIMQADLEEALDRTIAGPQRKSRIISPREREVIAYHEAGHALIGELMGDRDPVHKVTILPRGMSLGSVLYLPEEDRFLYSEKDLVARITSALGGRVAEEVVYGEVYTGAANDLEHVTRIARAMVCEYGMSPKLGTFAIGRRSSNPFLGRDYHEDRNYSEDVAKTVDDEIRAIVDRCHHHATEILTQHREKLDRIVAALLDRETLDRKEFLAILAGEELPPKVTAVAETPAATPEVAEPEKPTKSPMPPPRLEPGPA